jgi:ectoine hydroxylase-related dioxygenase (phytanoyl-CoA dioxygenase family)
MQLTHPQQQHLYEQGYVTVPGVVPQVMVDLEGMPKVPMPQPLQIHGRPGDFVLVHYLLGHAAAINVSSHMRYAIFFRLSHIEHREHRWESMSDVRLEWEGMREIVAVRGGRG